jgi:hypothetical protein
VTGVRVQHLRRFQKFLHAGVRDRLFPDQLLRVNEEIRQTTGILQPAIRFEAMLFEANVLSVHLKNFTHPIGISCCRGWWFGIELAAINDLATFNYLSRRQQRRERTGALRRLERSRTT